MPSGYASNRLFWKTEAPLVNEHPMIIFIHASWMSTTMWDETVQLLAPNLPNINLVRIDLAGHGKTTSSRNEFSLWDQAENALALLREFNLSKVIITGISMGSAIAIRMALLDQSRFSGLILLASSAKEMTDAQRDSFNQLRDVWISTPTPSEQIMNAAILSWGGNPDLNGPPAMRIKKHLTDRHSGAENIDPVLNSIMRMDSVLGRLGEIHIPVLMIHGENDMNYSLQDAKGIQQRLVNADARLEVIKDEGHLVVHLREASDVAGWMQEFVKRIVT
ncbi:alpha/beta fold hydrolase [Aspergillus clavatus NRRL 1]|uniref:Alpha/beta hydrolase, putative n=1 Tax=Aspergillus clavatus (strain ATCC 1007 / CBS 513.65 / DSM 816 / NCTC 3887 / NRRL 1 / QM 1276 / 107) TaxID=344612 RepID=A1CGH6_ASPCL|nr:alpha/beta hydrolase, putative [Aspergillus clavatus NRRL 1]EAW11056.1 alpha/beta hydrolase, putative [Aspergillus clavatus NRRL 1]